MHKMIRLASGSVFFSCMRTERTICQAKPTENTACLSLEREVKYLRQKVVMYEYLMNAWIQFTEDKWRTVSDSQLGWKPLRGRWSNWDDVYEDAYEPEIPDLAEVRQ